MRMFDKNKVFTTRQQNDGCADRDRQCAHGDDVILGSESVETTLQKNVGLQYCPQSIIVSAPMRTNSQQLTTFQQAASSSVDASTPRNDANTDLYSKFAESIKIDDEDRIRSMDSRDDNSHDDSVSSSRSNGISDCRDDGSLSDGSVINSVPSHEEHHEEYQAASTLPLNTSSSVQNYHNSEPFRCSKPSTAGRCKYQSILRPAKFGKCNNNTNSNTVCEKTTTPKLSARFSVVEIREYPITLGDNPGGVQGPPICLDWKHDIEHTVLLLLNEYEAMRPPRRCQEELYLPECLRRWKLLEKGVSMRAMQKASKSAENVRRQRRNTIKNLQSQQGPLSGFTDMVRQLVGS